MKTRFLLLSVGVALLCLLSGCHSRSKGAAANRVVVYCSVDEVYARPILKRIEKQTGLRIDAIFDTEAAKTAGLSVRIQQEKDRPQADVFWSSALLQTLLLERKGLLQPYLSATTRDVPFPFKTTGGSWTGMAARARVLVYHTGLPNPPRTLDDLKQPRFRGRIGISNPQFGSASDWVSALALRRGTKQTLQLFQDLKANGLQVLPGNSVVADKVSRGELLAGFCDTDDYLAEKTRNGGIALSEPPPPTISPAKGEKVSQVVIIPISVAMIHGAPHSEAAQKLMDALLSRQTEAELATRMPGALPLRTPLPAASADLKAYQTLLKETPYDYLQWPNLWDDVRDPLNEILMGPSESNNKGDSPT